jgi:hypothetical protein
MDCYLWRNLTWHDVKQRDQEEEGGHHGVPVAEHAEAGLDLGVVHKRIPGNRST